MAVCTYGDQLGISCLNVNGVIEFGSVKVFSVTALNLQVLALHWPPMVSKIDIDFRFCC